MIKIQNKESLMIETLSPIRSLCFDYPHFVFNKSAVVRADCFDWLTKISTPCIHAVVTDPPYGVKEFELDQLEKRKNGNGGIWRLPPAFDGKKRAPLPRFTALTSKQRNNLKDFFYEWAKLIERVLYPGAYVFMASNAFLSQLVFSAIVDGGLEFRGELIRLVKTLRGGDRPKNAEDVFPNVSSLPRGAYEPWGVFRKELPKGMKVSDCLKTYKTGGLRRKADGLPFCDVIPSYRTPKNERDIAQHPSLKPQGFLRQIVHTALPLGEGIILDPFSGSGSTLAAAEACGLQSLGIEKNNEYFTISTKAVPRLVSLRANEEEDDKIQQSLW